MLKSSNRFSPRRLPVRDLYNQDTVTQVHAGMFAQSRAVNGPIVFPSHNAGVISQIAKLGAAKAAADSAPVNAGIAITAPANVTIPADYLGNILSGLPVTLTPAITYLGVNVAADPRTTYVISGENATFTTAGGAVTVTAISGLNFRISWNISFGGQFQQTVAVTGQVEKAAPPPPSPTAQVFNLTLAPVSSSTAQLLGTFTNLSAGNWRLNLSSLFHVTSDEVTSNIELVLAQRVAGSGGVFTNIPGAVFTGVEAQFIEFYEDYYRDGYYRLISYSPGSILLSIDPLVIPIEGWDIAVFGRLLYGSAVSIASPILLETV